MAQLRARLGHLAVVRKTIEDTFKLRKENGGVSLMKRQREPEDEFMARLWAPLTVH